ncbi:hypothetical protein Nepgr_014481 [Nepenthes gracilis]|uniref:Transmembrane protein n=1 Tax=Nepenthes gracilis TaxID=150966 RepID=A0AAD3SKX1_NEPGR|nr:hypothetical protein Nepgr_014481 [Nepenthes gracilis]
MWKCSTEPTVFDPFVSSRTVNEFGYTAAKVESKAEFLFESRHVHLLSIGVFQTVFRASVVIAMSRSRNAIVATGLVAFAAAGLAFPFYMASSKAKPVIDSSKPLPPQATFRGPYINTGSRDVGPDHQTYPKKAN